MSSLTLLLVMQTGDHIAVPKERDSILTIPAESTVTGVPSSENLNSETKKKPKMYTLTGKFSLLLTERHLSFLVYEPRLM